MKTVWFESSESMRCELEEKLGREEEVRSEIEMSFFWALEIRCIGKATVEASNLSVHRGLKDSCFEYLKTLCVVVLQFVHKCRPYSFVRLLYEILSFVVNYYIELYVRLLKICFSNYVGLKLENDN